MPCNLLLSPEESIIMRAKHEGREVHIEASLCWKFVARILGLKCDTIVECWASTLV